jgi:hypothetical protein
MPQETGNFANPLFPERNSSLGSLENHPMPVISAKAGIQLEVG